MQSVVIIVQLLSLLTTNAKVETFQFYIHKWLLKLSSLVLEIKDILKIKIKSKVIEFMKILFQFKF
jgi:hypothetical protein